MRVKKSVDQIIKEAAKKLQKYCAKETLFRIPGEGKLGEWRTIKSPFAPAVKKFLVGKYPTVIIANEDPMRAAADWTLINEEGCDE